MAQTQSQPKNALRSVLITGGCGFLGHHIVNQLCDSYSNRVSVIDLRTTNNRRPDSDGVQYFDADVTDGAALLRIFEQVKPDVVIHTASPNGNDNVSARPIFQKVNVEGTRAVIEACRMANVKALVYTSSASIISDNNTDLINADERWPVLLGKSQPDYYSWTKAQAEQLVLAANRMAPSPLLTCSIRPSGIMGEGDPQLVPGMLEVYFQKRTGFQLGSNDNLFDFTYVGNVAHAHLLAAQALLVTFNSSTAPLDHEKVDGEAFIITNDSPIYFWDFARMFWKAAGSELGTEHVWTISKEIGLPLAALAEFICLLLGKQTKFTKKAFKFSCMTRYYNIGKARSRLGYKPLVSLQEGVERATKWYVEERAKAQEKKGQ